MIFLTEPFRSPSPSSQPPSVTQQRVLDKGPVREKPPTQRRTPGPPPTARGAHPEARGNRHLAPALRGCAQRSPALCYLPEEEGSRVRDTPLAKNASRETQRAHGQVPAVAPFCAPQLDLSEPRERGGRAWAGGGGRGGAGGQPPAFPALRPSTPRKRSRAQSRTRLRSPP